MLNDLHDLLQHYEECHVRLDDDEDSNSLFDGENDSWSSLSSFNNEDELGESNDIDLLKKKAAAYLSDYYPPGPPSDDDDNVEVKKISGKKRPFNQISVSSNSAIELLTQSAVKKIALASSFGNHAELHSSLMNDQDFLAQAGAILASANLSM